MFEHYSVFTHSCLPSVINYVGSVFELGHPPTDKEKAYINASGNLSTFPTASATSVTTPYLRKITVNNTTNNVLIQISTMLIANQLIF